MEAQTLLTDAGKEIPADEVRIKLVKDIEISGEWTPIKFPVREFDGNGHTITFDGIRVVIEESSKEYLMSVCLKKWVVKRSCGQGSDIGR